MQPCRRRMQGDTFAHFCMMMVTATARRLPHRHVMENTDAPKHPQAGEHDPISVLAHSMYNLCLQSNTILFVSNHSSSCEPLLIPSSQSLQHTMAAMP